MNGAYNMGRVRLNLDSKLDRDLNQIMESFRQQGFKNVKKPDVLRLLIEDYKNRGYKQKITRQPKKRQWMML